MPKGDAHKLRADLDDDFARVSNLLLEALSCAPLSGAQFRVMAFVIRRTYGWSRKHEPAHKGDLITAAEIADGTGLLKRTVQDTVASLVREHVILSDLATPDGRRYYGPNPDVNSWGTPTADWALFRTTIRDSRDRGTYKPVQPYGEFSIPILGLPHTPTEITGEVPATNPTTAGVSGVPTENGLTENDKNGLTDSLVPAAVGAEHGVEIQEVQPPKPTPEEQIATLRAAFPPEDMPAVDEWIDFVRCHRARNRLGKPGERAQLGLLLEVRRTTGVTSEGFAHGIRDTIRRDIENTNYVKTVALGFTPGGNGPSRASPRASPRRLFDSAPSEFPEKSEVLDTI